MKRQLDYILGVPLLKFTHLFVKKNSASFTSPQKILVIKLAAAGDTILLLPFMEALQKAFPQFQIDWMVSKINYQIAELSPIPKKIWIWQGLNPLRFLQLIRTIRKQKYSVVIDLEQWARGTALMAGLSGAPHRWGFDSPGQKRASLFTYSVKKLDTNHEQDEFYRVIPKSIEMEAPKPAKILETDRGKSEISSLPDKYFNSANNLKVLIHPGCGADGFPREWPLANYAVIGNWLRQTKNASIFLSGGPDEIKKTGDLYKLLNKKAINLGGRLSWQGTLSLLKKMDLVISGNTGVMHLAAASERPQVALHGPTNPVLWGPRNKKAVVVCSPCPQCPCLKLGFEYHSRTQSCMKQIDIPTVKKAIQEAIDKASEI